MKVASLLAEVLKLYRLTGIVTSPKVRRGDRETAEQLERGISVWKG